MERDFDAGVDVVLDTNGNVNENNVDVDVNARAREERSPAVVPIGRGEPSVAGVGTGEGMIVPPQSERWLSGIFRAIPSTQRVRSFVRTPETVIFLLGLAALISLIIFIFDLITSKSFQPLTVAVFFSAGRCCILLIQRPDEVHAEITEVRAAGISTRVITKEERRSLFHYFILRPPTPLENVSSCEDARSGASTPSGANTPYGHGDGRGEEGFSRKDFEHSSSDGEEAGKSLGGHPTNATVPPRDGSLGGGEGTVPTRGETRAVEDGTQRDGRRSGSVLEKFFGRSRPHGVDEMESMGAGARGQQHPHTAAVGEIVDGAPREEGGICAGAWSADEIAGCSRDGQQACSAPEEEDKDEEEEEEGAPPKEEGISASVCSTDDTVAGGSRDGHACSAPKEKETVGKNEEEALKRASWQWSTGQQCVVCFGGYSYGEDLCQLPCYHVYHAAVQDRVASGSPGPMTFEALLANLTDHFDGALRGVDLGTL